VPSRKRKRIVRKAHTATKKMVLPSVPRLRSDESAGARAGLRRRPGCDSKSPAAPASFLK
jgi:hypothetical protein